MGLRLDAGILSIGFHLSVGLEAAQTVVVPEAAQAAMVPGFPSFYHGCPEKHLKGDIYKIRNE